MGRTYIVSDRMREAESDVLEWGASEGMTRDEVIKSLRDELKAEGRDVQHHGIKHQDLLNYMTMRPRS